MFDLNLQPFIYFSIYTQPLPYHIRYHYITWFYNFNNNQLAMLNGEKVLTFEWMNRHF